MIFRWLKRRRRRKCIARPFPPEWSVTLEQNVPSIRRLDAGERQRLQDIVKVLRAEKTWEGCGGLSLTDEIVVTIAAQAAILILNIQHDYYRRVRSVLVYPSTFVLPPRPAHGGRIVSKGGPVLGLAHFRGPVVLAWDAVRHGAHNPEDGRNVVFHEFAHKLDLLDGCADGTPILADREQYGIWVRVMTGEFEALRDHRKRGRATVLDKYGAEEPVEFFAVATECFFEKSRTLARRHPELYSLLSGYYRQDPAEARR
jgi:Mlc titration factor MtfA (ptsG expression regulator)